MKVVVLMTSFNRKDRTKNCITSLAELNTKIKFTFVVADDNSNDGTGKMLELLRETYNIHIIQGTGKLFYSGGMRVCMQYVKNNIDACDYVLLVNDDVRFFEGCIERMIIDSRRYRSILVGATCDEYGELSYGAIRYIKGIRYTTLGIDEKDLYGDTFNGNCVLIPYPYFINTDSMDKHFLHALGDFDYGLSLKNAGYRIRSTNFYIGECNKNKSENVWGNNKLSIIQRIRLKESIKGAPFRQWFYFLKKNFGLGMAVPYSITPYIRILLKR